MKTYKNCQSCGMPMGKDPQKGGTEKDGKRSIWGIHLTHSKYHNKNRYLTKS